MKFLYIILIVGVVGALAFAGWEYFGGKEAIAPESGGLVGEFCGTSTYGVCSADADCGVQGCSSQICQSIGEEPMITTCEWRDCYDAEAHNYECKCIANTCQWASESE